jgi:hypothetical protein
VTPSAIDDLLGDDQKIAHCGKIPGMLFEVS